VILRRRAELALILFGLIKLVRRSGKVGFNLLFGQILPPTDSDVPESELALVRLPLSHGGVSGRDERISSRTSSLSTRPTGHRDRLAHNRALLFVADCSA
jgi:hypothetical protein